ncbi:MAG: glycosyltransferase, partial [Bacteroidota bacterium]|nr:glycosyltransferase [Bacteroidota bacterium]
RELKYDEKLIIQLLGIIRQYQPQNIYLPASSEIHPDHRVIYKAGTEAARRYAPNINLIYCEVGQMQSANLLLDITELHEQLNQAMDCFKSQLEVQDYKYHINALHAYRTYTLGKDVKYAEAYNLINSEKLKTGSELWKQKTVNINLPIKSEPVGPEYPLISVIVRTMDRPELAEALDCLSKQTYPNLEVIVVDALGTNELDIGKRCRNFPLRVVTKNKQLQRAAAANTGLQAVKGEYFCFLDEDDLLFPEHIDKLFGLLKNKKPPAAYSNIKRVNIKNELINIFNADFNFQELLWANFIPIHAMLYRTEPVKFNCLFDDRLEIYEDWDFLIQVGQLGDFTHLDELTGVYRDTNASGAQDDEEKTNKYKTLLYEKWKDKLTTEQYVRFLDHLATLNLPEKNHYKKKYNEALHKLEEAQDTIETLQKDNQKARVEHKTSIEEKEIASRIRKTLNRDIEIAVYKAENSILSKSLAEKDNLIAPKNNQINNSNDEIAQMTGSLSWRITRPLRLLSINKIKSRLRSISNKRKVKQSGLFDKAWYLENYPDVKQSGMDPLKHYLLFGGFEGRNPGPSFDSQFYLESNQDVKDSGLNPLLHYILYGKNEGRQII